MITQLFIQPFWLAAGLLACCGVMLFLRLRTFRRRKELEKFASPHLLPLLTANVSQTRRRMKSILFILGLACLFMALARPLWGSRWVELRHRGIDILIGFDVSKSMLAPDIKPSRLLRAKLAVRDFAARLDGDRIGLLPFAGTSFLICPLTTDYDAFTASLDALDTASIPKGGTNIGGVIRDAVQVLKKESNHKILILITDGGDLSQDALAAAALAKQEKMIIYAVGVGTAQGELIPLPDGGAGDFVKDPLGSFVTSKLDEKTLAAVAETTGGIYVPLGSMGQGLDTVYQSKLAMIPKEEHGRRKRKVPMERFQWLLGAAILLLSADFLLIGRRRKLRLPQIFTAGRRRKKLRQTAAAGLLCCALCATQARADQGIDLFQAEKYEQAAQYYADQLKERNDPVLHFNRGAALLKQEKYKEAAADFSKALQTDDVGLQAKSYYNRGISQYYAGRTAEQTDLGQAIAELKQAEVSFHAAAQLLPAREKQAKAAHYQKEAENERRRLERRQQDQQSKGEQKQNNPQQSGGKEKNQQSGQNNKQGNQDKQGQRKQQDGAANGKKPGSQQQENKPQPPQSEKSDAEKKQDKDGKDSSEQTQPQAAQAEDKQKKQPADGRQSKGERMKTGKMTAEEARSLLDSLKYEQGELNFIPQEAADGDDVGRDW
jgi:Ca-activated chloride channel family protein